MSITDIFREYGPHYYKRFEKSMPRAHKKTMAAITSCRTPQRGTIIAQCNDCNKKHVLFCACGNRHCPACQYHKAKAWLVKQIDRALPCNYFLLTFTVPEALRPFIRSHQRDGYNTLFTASAHAIRTLARNPRFCGGGQAGFTGVLHTWGRQVQHHPHVHYVVPGGTVLDKGKRWEASPPGFFLPVRALSKIFRAHFGDRMKKLNMHDLIPSSVWKQDWVVHSKPVGNAAHTLRYLARYVFKVAIANSRIVAVRDDTVTFRWKHKDSNRWRTSTLSAVEFIRRYLQHVLPTGFVKVRHYGFMNQNAGIDHDALSALVQLAHGPSAMEDKPEVLPDPFPQCPHCGGRLKYVAFSTPHYYERIIIQSG